MKVVNSEFLTNSKLLIGKLISMLSEDYEYVSVLGTDTKGKSFRVSKTGVEVNDSMLVERGFVIRIHNGVNYSEYSFNEISEAKLDNIAKDIKAKVNKVSKNVAVNSYEVIEEDEIKDSFFGEIKINPDEVGSDVIIKSLTEIKDAALDLSDLIVNVNVIYNTYHISKLYMSSKKELEQSYVLGEGYIFSIARREEKQSIL